MYYRLPIGLYPGPIFLLLIGSLPSALALLVLYKPSISLPCQPQPWKTETVCFSETLGSTNILTRRENPKTKNKNIFSFQSMLRVQKRYIFPYKVLPHSNDTVPGHVITFSSYPGTIQSGDDFYVTSAGLATLETTTGNNNHSLWQYVKPEGQVGCTFKLPRLFIFLSLHYQSREGHAMAQAITHQPLTMESRLHAQVNPCGICGGQSGTGTGFSEFFSFPLSISFHHPPYSYIILEMNNMSISGNSSET
jgi:hypothetical protein